MTRTPKNPAAERAPVALRVSPPEGEPGPASPPSGPGGKTPLPAAPPLPQPGEAQDRENGPVPAGCPSLPGSPLEPVEPGPSSVPGTGAAIPGRVQAPGRGRTKTPARDAGASPASLAGSQAIAAAMSEAELEIHVRALVKDLGLLWYHTHDSRHSPRGFPDLVIVGRGVIYRELKTTKGKVSDDQAEWLHALVMAEQDACVWRPADLVSGLIGRKLAALAGRRAGAA